MTSPAATAAPAARTPAGHAREKILATAFRLFYAQGFRAAGIDTIIAESGVAKATFYKYFPAKDDLMLAYLEKVDGVWTGQLHAAAEAAGEDPADAARGPVRCPDSRLPARRLPRLRLHQRGRRVGRRHPRPRPDRGPQAADPAPGSGTSPHAPAPGTRTSSPAA